MKNLILKALIFLSFFSFSVFPDSYSASTRMLGDRVVSIKDNMLAYHMSDTFFVKNDISFAYGITNSFDVWSTVVTNTTNKPSGSISTTSFRSMLRYNIKGDNVLACVIGDSYISPQYQIIEENKQFSLQVNLAGQFDYNSVKRSSAYAVIAPIVKVFGGCFDLAFNSIYMDAFCEVNPGYYRDNANINNYNRNNHEFDVDVVPGIGVGYYNSMFSLACPVYNANHKAQVSVGVSWMYVISTNRAK